MLGCQQNYKHILQTSLNRQWVDGGKFPISISAYTTIPKALRGGVIDWKELCYLDIVHFNIAFGDCISPGGYWYVLIFVDRATRYNWVFGWKDLSRNSILSAFCLFYGDAGAYAQCFWSDCNTKLFGTEIHKHLIDNDLNIIAAVAAGCQSANGLVDLHWKVMVHTLWAYLSRRSNFLIFLILLCCSLRANDDIGSGIEFVKFSNGPNTNSECSNLLN